MSENKAKSESDFRQKHADAKEKLRRLSESSMLLALCLLFSWLEAILPPPPLPIPLKYGLANVVVMFALLYVGRGQAVLLAFSKAVFSFLIAGPLAGALSLSGSLLSVSAMILLDFLTGRKTSLILLSVIGALSHNTGQFLIFAALYREQARGLSLTILPAILLLGLIAGTLTAILLKALSPALLRLSKRFTPR